MTAALALFALLVVPQQPVPQQPVPEQLQRPGSNHPLSKDATGIRWALPFTAARAAAEKRKRLLLIKPVAFGTTRDGGW